MPEDCSQHISGNTSMVSCSRAGKGARVAHCNGLKRCFCSSKGGCVACIPPHAQVGIKAPDQIARPSVRNDAAFLATVTGEPGDARGEQRQAMQ